tara:strand:+ start:970 stop:1101 length:132 start_codon:yes stop_codon:yes gene_type:complete
MQTDEVENRKRAKDDRDKDVSSKIYKDTQDVLSLRHGMSGNID